MCTESTASGESAIDGATSNIVKDIVDSPTLPLPQEKVRLLYNVYCDIIAVYSKHTGMTYWYNTYN